MKDILLVNPWITDFTAHDFWLKPLGLLFLASILRENSDCRLHFVDCLDRSHPRLKKRGRGKPDGRGHFPKVEIPKPEPLRDVPRRFSRYGIPVELFREELEKRPRPDAALLTSGMTYWYPGVALAVELIRRKWGSVPVVLGGNYATLLPEHARRNTGADVVAEGPAENSVLHLLQNILGDGIFRPRDYSSFQDLPSPSFDLLGDRLTLPLLTSRGCPFRCSFCAAPTLHPRFEQRSPGSVVAEIGDSVRRWQTRNFAFYDDALLLCKDNHIVPILEAVAARNLGAAFHTPNGLHVREIDRSLAGLFRRAGVTSLYLSQESFDERLLAGSCPKVSPGDLEAALGHLEVAGYNRRAVNVYLIVGLPDQDLGSVRESIRRVRRLGARPRVAYFSPVPGTEEWKKLVDRGILPSDADPLLHNKLAFAYIWGRISRPEFDDLRRLLTEPV
jgi:radical SAM superfamily enzyme YgiQ (UPF0313 family)